MVAKWLEHQTLINIVGNGICALLEMPAELDQQWSAEVQWKH